MFDMPHVFFSIAFLTSMSYVITSTSVILGISLLLFVQLTNLLRKGKTSFILPINILEKNTRADIKCQLK